MTDDPSRLRPATVPVAAIDRGTRSRRPGRSSRRHRRRIGVYVCHCGGNISDYVDVDQVVAAAQGEPGVVVARQMMFACSDAGQGEMERDIEEQHLDGLVVASCSPKLHVATFRGVAKRAGLNPYEYTQVNVREQASWIHSRRRPGRPPTRRSTWSRPGSPGRC